MQQDEEGFQPVSRHTAKHQGIINTGPGSKKPANTLTDNIFNVLQEEGEVQTKGGEGDHTPHG